MPSHFDFLGCASLCAAQSETVQLVQPEVSPGKVRFPVVCDWATRGRRGDGATMSSGGSETRGPLGGRCKRMCQEPQMLWWAHADGAFHKHLAGVGRWITSSMFGPADADGGARRGAFGFRHALIEVSF